MHIYASLGRRLFFGLALTFGSANLLLQCYFVHFTSVLVLAVLGLLRPLNSSSAHRLEYCNEILILALFSLFSGMTDLISDLELRNKITWSIIGLISMSIVINFSLIIKTNVTHIWTYCKLRRLRAANRAKYQEAVARRQAIDEYRKSQLESIM